jgi:hypothetical protein
MSHIFLVSAIVFADPENNRFAIGTAFLSAIQAKLFLLPVSIAIFTPSIRKIKPDKKNSLVSFPFPVPNVEGVWKNLKMSHSMIDNSAV